MSKHMPGTKQRFTCGCEARVGIETISLIRCQTHEAASELLEAGAALVGLWDAAKDGHERSNVLNSPKFWAAIKGLRAAIAKAK